MLGQVLGQVLGRVAVEAGSKVSPARSCIANSGHFTWNRSRAVLLAACGMSYDLFLQPDRPGFIAAEFQSETAWRGGGKPRQQTTATEEIP
jgi:hypothetical protein